MKKFSFLLLGIMVLFGLAGCTQSDTTQETLPKNITTEDTITTPSTDAQAILEAHEYYSMDNSLRIQSITISGNYAVGLLEEYDIMGGVEDRRSIQFLAGKFDGQWIHLYEGNSGEVSCSLTEKFGVPKELIIQGFATCYEGIRAKYTIPDEAYEYYIISSFRQSSVIKEYLKFLCNNNIACNEEEFDSLRYTITHNDGDGKRTEFTINFSEAEQYIYNTTSNTFYRIRPIDGGKDTITLQ